jgi:hypothetical protein
LCTGPPLAPTAPGLGEAPPAPTPPPPPGGARPRPLPCAPVRAEGWLRRTLRKRTTRVEMGQW